MGNHIIVCPLCGWHYWKSVGHDCEKDWEEMKQPREKGEG